MTKNVMKVLVLLMAVVMMSPIVALAEEDVEIAAPVVEQVEAPKAEAPKAEEPKVEAPKAEEPKAEAPAVEAPKAEEVQEEVKAEEPAVEETPTEMPAVEESVESEIIVEAAEDVAEEVEIEEEETPLGVFPVEDAATGFNAMVKVELKDEQNVYFGEKVTLIARVSGANAPYSLRWEVDRQDGEGWKVIPQENEAEYDFIITPDNVNYEYRVVLAA